MRAAPPRRFENYVLTRLVDSSVGLTQVPATSFTQVPGPGAFTSADAYNGAGAGGTDDATSNVLPIVEEIRRAGAKTLREIAAALQARGVKTPRGGSGWTAMAVKRVLDRAAVA